MTKILTPDALDKLVAKAKSNQVLDFAVTKSRYELAREWLDDGQWIKQSRGVWKRSLEGKKFYYYVGSDRMKLSQPFKDSLSTLPGAFEFCLRLMYETVDGFGPNTIKDMEKSSRSPDDVNAASKLQTYHKIDPGLLVGKEKRWNENIPPSREEIEQQIRWEPNDRFLLKVNEDRGIEEIVLSDFVELNGETYACWRILSMLLWDTPDGYMKRDIWDRLKGTFPKGDAPLLDAAAKEPETVRLHIKRRYKLPSERQAPKVVVEGDMPEPERLFAAAVAAGKEEKQKRYNRRLNPDPEHWAKKQRQNEEGRARAAAKREAELRARYAQDRAIAEQAQEYATKGKWRDG